MALLDNIRSMHNVGSIFRTSDGVGVEHIYLCGYTPSPLHEKLGHLRPQIKKVALGSTDFIGWEKCSSAWRQLDKLKDQGYTIITLEQTKESINVNKFQLSKKQWNNSVLVLGNEVKGVSKSILERSDYFIDIPMVGKKKSLNVSVAYGIAMYCLYFNIKI